MAPPLLPLSSLAGKLTLSFTGAVQVPVTEPPPTLPPEGAVVVPAPPPAAPPATTPPPAVDPFPAAPAISSAEMRREVDDAGRSSRTPAPVVRPSLLRATEKRHFFSLFVGGSRSLRGGYAYFPGTDFKLEAAIGGHGRNYPRLAGAAVLQVRSGYPLTSFTFAPRLQWDVPILPEYAIYLTTTLTAGYRFSSYAGGGIDDYGDPGSNIVAHGGVAAVGFGASTIVGERLLLSFRPVNLEVEGSTLGTIGVHWDILGGIGVIW